jgi:transposase
MAVATLREARGVCGATLGFLKRRLTGREPALVASFFPRRARRRRRGDGMSTNKRGRLRPTHQWDLLVPLFEWPEQKRYEEIRPLVLFDVSVAEEVGLSQSTLYRKLGGFEVEGMESLFASQTATKRKLPPTVRRFIVDLKAEPHFNLNEIANVVQASFGRKPDVRSVARVLAEEPVPLKIVRNYPPYHEIADPREGRAAIVELRLSGWSAKAIAGYLGVHKATVYRALQRGGKKGGSRAWRTGPPGGRPASGRRTFLRWEGSVRTR